MSLQVGIVGLPNIGKSTLFNILLDKAQAQAGNFPFTTIQPNLGLAPVPDIRLETLSLAVYKNTKIRPPIIPAMVKFVDIAGLVKGAHKGEGLGNLFLSHIMKVDVIVQVVRVFEDNNVVKTGTNPIEDINTIKTELALKDLETLEKHLNKLKGKQDNLSQKQRQIISYLIKKLSGGHDLTQDNLDDQSLFFIESLFLLSTKPTIYFFNLSETQLTNDGLKQKLSDKVRSKPTVFGCLKTEACLIGTHPEERKEYLSLLGQNMSSVDNLIQLAYKQLKLISFFTAGVKEVKAWPITKGTAAVHAAGIIHSDFSKNFIKAKVAKFNDFIKYGSWTGLKQSGKLQLKGRDYIVQDGDVIEFMINT